MERVNKLWLIIFIDFLLLLYGISELSISYKEAKIFFDSSNFLHYLVNLSTTIFGQNDYALRLPFVFFHLLSVILLYKISGNYIKEEKIKLYTIILFILLPGVVSSSLIVNSSSITIFFTLLLIYIYQYKKYLFYPLLFLLLFIDSSFEVLYLGLFAYGIYKHDKKLFITSAILFILSLSFYGFDSGGKPRGFFLDTLAMYALIFSPLLFLYYFYTMYRILFKQEKDLLWFISFTAFSLSIILSFRQRIPLSEFAPFAVIAIPLVVQNFLKSYKVRLVEFRKPYKIGLWITIVFLVINFLITYLNKSLYLILENPDKNFAKKFHIAHQLADKLKSLNINNILCEDEKICLRLKFYNISLGKDYLLSLDKKSKMSKKVTISYKNRVIKSYFVTKLHK